MNRLFRSRLRFLSALCDASPFASNRSTIMFSLLHLSVLFYIYKIDRSAVR